MSDDLTVRAGQEPAERESMGTRPDGPRQALPATAAASEAEQGALPRPEPRPSAEATLEPSESADQTGGSAPENGSTRRLGRRLIGTVLPAVLVLGALGGGIAYTGVTIAHADKTAPTETWEEGEFKPGTDPATEVDRGRKDTALTRQLLPVPRDFRLGPDLGEYGNDAEIPARQAAAVMKESSTEGLAGRARREAEKRIDRLGLKGVALRSYAAGANDLLVEDRIVQMEDRVGVKRMYAFTTRFLKDIGGREGPAVTDHRNAKCLRGPKGEDIEIEEMICAAYDGELYVEIDAFGSAPLRSADVERLFTEQLDHLSSTGGTSV